MDKSILLQRIEPYNERFNNFYRLGHVRFSQRELEDLAEIVKEINPKINLRFVSNCSSCLRDAIRLLSNFYKRELKYINTEPQLPVDFNEDVPEVEVQSSEVNTVMESTPFQLDGEIESAEVEEAPAKPKRTRKKKSDSPS